MNAKQTAAVISNTCRDLLAMGVVSFYNSPRVIQGGGRELVTWPTQRSGSSTLHPFGSLGQYLDWVREGEFTCLLFDLSLIRASYECVGATIIGHSVLYWPCPVDFRIDVQGLDELCDGIEMCLESAQHAHEVCGLTMRAPMRFDFDPIRESDDHPLVHLHTQFENTRISVQQAMCFPSFMKRVLRTFYGDLWSSRPDIDDIHEQGLEHEDGACDPPAKCFQLTWT